MVGYAYDPTFLARLLPRLRAAAAPVSITEDAIDPSISADPSFASNYPELVGAGVGSPLDRPPTPVPDFVAAPPLDPLRREVPVAPKPVDVAGIEAEERAAVEAERGPRIKPNPKGWKGVGLGIVKGLVGLAEGYARSGARDWLDAIAPMAEGASRRISDYQTNREDYVPFDADVTQRVKARIDPLLRKYGQDRQGYTDAMDRYRVETEVERHDEGKAERDRAFGLQREQLDVTKDRYEKQDEREREQERRLAEKTRLDHDIAQRRIDAQLKLGIARIRDAGQRGRVAAQHRAAMQQIQALKDQEAALVREATDLDKQKRNKKLDAGTVAGINERIAEVNRRLGDIRGARAEAINGMASLADEIGAGSSGGRRAVVAPDVKRQVDAIKAAVASSEMSREDGLEALRELGFQ